MTGFGHGRNVPDGHATLRGHAMPVVPMYKHFGVILTSHITLHAQQVVDRGHRLFALCVSWCQSEHLPVTLASSIFMTHVLPSVAWYLNFSLGLLQRCVLFTAVCANGCATCWAWQALRCVCVCVCVQAFCWNFVGLPPTGCLQVEFSLWSRTSSMAVHPRCPIPAKVLQIASGVPGTWHTIPRLCVPFLVHTVLTPLGSPQGLPLAGLVADSVTTCVADLTMTCASAAMLTLVQFPLSSMTATFGPDSVVNGRGSPSVHARTWGLAR